MAKARAARPDAATAIATELVAILEAQRDVGKEAYPLTLQRLAELASKTTTDETFKKALGKKPFSERGIISQKDKDQAPVVLIEDVESLAANPLLLEFVLEALCTPEKRVWALKQLIAKVHKDLKKPFEDAVTRQIRENKLSPAVGYQLVRTKPVFFLQRLKPVKAEEALAGRLWQVFNAQKQLGGDAYPLNLKRLIELTDPKAAKAVVKKALALPILSDHLLYVNAKDPKALIALKEDRNQLLSHATLLEYLVRVKSTANQQAFPVSGLFPPRSDLIQPFVEMVKQRIDTNTLPPTIGWMWIGKKQHVFFLENVHHSMPVIHPPVPVLPAPPLVTSSQHEAIADFAHRFDEAFKQLDRHKGGHNFVSLVELRRALPLSVELFNVELRKLRLAGRYTLSAAEGRHGLTPEDHAAGIMEDGSLLLFVSRKNA